MSKEMVCPDCAEVYWCKSDYMNHRTNEHGDIS